MGRDGTKRGDMLMHLIRKKEHSVTDLRIVKAVAAACFSTTASAAAAQCAKAFQNHGQLQFLI